MASAADVFLRSKKKNKNEICCKFDKKILKPTLKSL